jgi:hypothetical protein
MLAGGKTMLKGDDSWPTKRALACKMANQLSQLTLAEQADLLEKLLDALDPVMIKALDIAYTTRERGESK